MYLLNLTKWKNTLIHTFKTRFKKVWFVKYKKMKYILLLQHEASKSLFLQFLFIIKNTWALNNKTI